MDYGKLHQRAGSHTVVALRNRRKRVTDRPTCYEQCLILPNANQHASRKFNRQQTLMTAGRIQRITLASTPEMYGLLVDSCTADPEISAESAMHPIPGS